MALTASDAIAAGFAEIRSLVEDLARIAFSQALLALRLFYSPSQFIETLAGVPDLMFDRIGEAPKNFVRSLLTQLKAFPLNKKIRSRVMTGEAARSWLIGTIAGEVVLLADPPSRRIARGVASIVGGGGLPRLRERLESYLGKLQLTAQENLLARVLGTLLSPARVIIWLLRVWDVFVQLAITVIGFVLLVAVYALLRSPQGETDIAGVCLQQTNKRRYRPVLEEGFVSDLSPFLFSLRGPPFPRPPWSASDVTQFSLTRKRYRVRGK